MSDKQDMATTPKGKVMFAHLNKPDTRFDEDGVFKMDLELDPKKDEEHAKFLSYLKETAGEGKGPYAAQKDPESGEETGRWLVHFKSRYKPKVFDSDNQAFPEDVDIANGSVVRVAYRLNHYKGFGGGVNLYLQGVQVIECIEWKGATADSFGFGKVEGGFVSESMVEAADEAADAMFKDGPDPVDTGTDDNEPF